jgi:hypothetical protein
MMIVVLCLSFTVIACNNSSEEKTSSDSTTTKMDTTPVMDTTTKMDTGATKPVSPGN